MSIFPQASGADVRGRLLVAQGPPHYADDVVITLTRVDQTPSGRALLTGVGASGRTVRIRPPALTIPPNASVQPLDLAAAATTGSDVVIDFDPAHWPAGDASGSPSADATLFVLLREALAALRGAADPPGYPEASALEAASGDLARYLAERAIAPAPRAPR